VDSNVVSADHATVVFAKNRKSSVGLH